jgi:hypothetical protein
MSSGYDSDHEFTEAAYAATGPPKAVDRLGLVDKPGLRLEPPSPGAGSPTEPENEVVQL